MEIKAATLTPFKYDSYLKISSYKMNQMKVKRATDVGKVSGGGRYAVMKTNGRFVAALSR